MDDDIHVAVLLAEVLKREGHEVAVANDGEEGLALLPEFRPEAVLLDVRLGELNGVAVLRKIRRQDTALPVILLTGYPDSPEVDVARQLGVTDVLPKPDLLDRLHKALAALGPACSSDSRTP